MKTEFESRELSLKILGTFGSQKAFAEAMQMSPKAISNRLNNRSEWKYGEIVKAIEVLGIDASKDGARLFFTVKKS